MSTGATFEGVTQLRDTLDAAARDLQDLSGPAREAGEVIEQAVVSEAPRDTGYLSTNVGVEASATGAVVTIAAPYAAAVNAQNPFKQRALDATTNQVIEIYTNAVADIVDKIQGA